MGTALILGTLLANRLGATLRLATLNEPPDAGALGQVLSAANIELQQPFEAVFTPPSGNRSLSVSEQDCFLSTSWWTTRALLSSIKRERLCYILQEDERMFYPFNDERLRCQHTLQEPGVFVAMNTHLLYHHLTSGPYSIPGLAERSYPFEPAFPGHQKDRKPRQSSPTGRRQLFFMLAQIIHGIFFVPGLMRFLLQFYRVCLRRVIGKSNSLGATCPTWSFLVQWSRSESRGSRGMSTTPL